jgi:hypothetical protein
MKRRHLAVATPVADPVDAAIREAGRVTAARGPQHHSSGRRVGIFHWTWEVTDHAVSPHELLASGRAMTERGMLRRRHRAYLRLLGGAR